MQLLSFLAGVWLQLVARSEARVKCRTSKTNRCGQNLGIRLLGCAFLWFEICFVGYQLTPDTSSYAHFWSNRYLHCDCELPSLLPAAILKPWLLCRQLFLSAGVGSAILKSLHTRFHQKVTAIICLNLFHYFFNYNTLSYLGFFKYSGGCNMLRLLPMPF